MSNGVQNCLTQVCCPPPAAEEKFASFLRKAAEAATVRRPTVGEVSFGDEYAAMAAAVFAEYDLAPRGWIPQMIASYRPIFEQDVASRKASGA